MSVLLHKKFTWPDFGGVYTPLMEMGKNLDATLYVLWAKVYQIWSGSGGDFSDCYVLFRS